MSKRIFSLFLVLAFVFSLSACRSQTANQTDDTGEVSSVKQDEPTKTPEQPDTDKDNSSKAAIVYFSATGTTKKVAELIAAETGAELFEIVPREVYSSDDLNYSNDNCRANREMNDENARPEISNDLSAVSGYDTVYLGYPIWWGTAPRIIQTFLESYNISSKTVYIFCTSGGSGIEKSITDLNALYSDLNIVSGKRLSAADIKGVKNWIENLK